MLIPITCKPKSSLKNKTGSWRTTIKPKIIQDKCTGCRLCVPICPENCIIMKDKKAQPDFNYCKGCGLCAEICPVDAVQMVPEQQEEKE